MLRKATNGYVMQRAGIQVANEKDERPKGTGGFKGRMGEVTTEGNRGQTASLRVLVGHPTPLVREGIESLAERTGDIQVIGQTGDSEALIDMVRQLDPDVVVTGIGYGEPAPVEFVRALKDNSRAPVLVMVSAANEDIVVEAMRAGAGGCILEDAPPDVLRIAVRAVAGGGTWIQRELTESLVAGLRTTGRFHGRDGERLTERETEVARLVCAGHSNASIAEALFIEASTVRAHISNILQKLGLENRVELVLYAIRRGLVQV
jgi:two-component system response regulator NreC